MSDQRPLTPEDVQALLVKAADLAMQLNATFDKIDAYEGQEDCPRWWRRAQRRSAEAITKSCVRAEAVEAAVLDALERMAIWIAKGKPDV